jgi:hypothetical protein
MMVLHKRVQLMTGLLVVLFSVACVLPTPMPASLPTSRSLPTSTPLPTATPPVPTLIPEPTQTSVPTLIPTLASTPSHPTAWQGTVDALAALQSAQEVPDHFLTADPVRTGEEFDVNEYFSILSHLSMEPRYVLDYVYCYEFMGGFPVLYARPENQSRYATYSEFIDAEGDSAYYDFLNHVRVDGSEEGFFQFALLHVIGDQFYLIWHANYNDWRVVCDHEALEDILTIPDDFGQPFTEEQKEAALAIDLSPVVEIGGDTVHVRIVMFTKWGGFIQLSYAINRDFPHAIQSIDSDVLVEYDCGVMF